MKLVSIRGSADKREVNPSNSRIVNVLIFLMCQVLCWLLRGRQQKYKWRDHTSCFLGAVLAFSDVILISSSF